MIAELKFNKFVHNGSEILTIARKFSETVTPEQELVLCNNVFQIEKDDLINSMYKGNGHGWIEIDKEGNYIDLKYAISLKDSGYGNPNILCKVLKGQKLEPIILENGNIRFLVNFTSNQLIRA